MEFYVILHVNGPEQSAYIVVNSSSSEIRMNRAIATVRTSEYTVAQFYLEYYRMVDSDYSPTLFGNDDEVLVHGCVLMLPFPIAEYGLTPVARECHLKKFRNPLFVAWEILTNIYGLAPVR